VIDPTLRPAWGQSTEEQIEIILERQESGDGEQLRNVRTRRLLTQDELAEKAGVSQSTIANAVCTFSKQGAHLT